MMNCKEAGDGSEVKKDIGALNYSGERDVSFKRSANDGPCNL